MARALWRGRVVAETDAPVLFDRNVYFPPAALKRGFFRASDHRSVCPWKGTAGYFTLVDGDAESVNAAWVYRDPKPEAEAIRDHVAFWKDVVVDA